MRRHQDIRQLVERLTGRERGTGFSRIAIPDIEGGAGNPSLGQGPIEGVLIDDLRARDVDEDRRGFVERSWLSPSRPRVSDVSGRVRARQSERASTSSDRRKL